MLLLFWILDVGIIGAETLSMISHGLTGCFEAPHLDFVVYSNSANSNRLSGAMHDADH